MYSIYISNVINVINQSFFYKRSLRKNLTNKKYFRKSIILCKLKDSSLVYKRAPKHFKRGKQEICFFKGLFRKKQVLNLKHPAFWILDSSPLILSYVDNYFSNTKFNSLIIGRFSLSVDIIVKYND